MKTMKRTIAFLLVLILCFSLSAVSFGAGHTVPAAGSFADRDGFCVSAGEYFSALVDLLSASDSPFDIGSDVMLLNGSTTPEIKSLLVESASAPLQVSALRKDPEGFSDGNEPFEMLMIIGVLDEDENMEAFSYSAAAAAYLMNREISDYSAALDFLEELVEQEGTWVRIDPLEYQFSQISGDYYAFVVREIAAYQENYTPPSGGQTTVGTADGLTVKEYMAALPDVIRQLNTDVDPDLKVAVSKEKTGYYKVNLPQLSDTPATFGFLKDGKAAADGDRFDAVQVLIESGDEYNRAQFLVLITAMIYLSRDDIVSFDQVNELAMRVTDAYADGISPYVEGGKEYTIAGTSSLLFFAITDAEPGSGPEPGQSGQSGEKPGQTASDYVIQSASDFVKLKVTKGVPIREVVEITDYWFSDELTSGSAAVYRVTAQQLDNGYTRLCVEFTGPKKYSISAFDPPNGKKIMIWKEKLTTGNRSLLVVDLKDAKLKNVSHITLKFFNKNASSRFWVSLSSAEIKKAWAAGRLIDQAVSDFVKLKVTKGIPVRPAVEITDFWFKDELKSGSAAVYRVTAQKLDNGYTRLCVEFTGPKKFDISVFDPPNGKKFMILEEKLTTGKRSLLVVDLKDTKLDAVSYVTLKFFENKRESNCFWVGFNTSQIKKAWS